MSIFVHCERKGCNKKAQLRTHETDEWFTLNDVNHEWHFCSGWCIAVWAASWANLPNESTIAADGLDAVPQPGGITVWIVREEEDNDEEG